MQPVTSYGPIEIWNSMGTVGHLVLVFLLLMSVYSMAIMFDRWVLFRKARRQSLEFVRAARRMLSESRLEEVVSEAGRHPANAASNQSAANRQVVDRPCIHRP